MPQQMLMVKYQDAKGTLRWTVQGKTLASYWL